MKILKKRLITSFLLCPLFLYAEELWAGITYKVYSYPDVIVDSPEGSLTRSDFYTVKLRQNKENSDVYVMQDANTFILDNPESAQGRLMTRNNHTVNFSFSGSLQVVISRKDGKTMQGSIVYPKQKNYNYSIEGEDLVINLSSWAYLYVEVPDLQKEPLFIFADPQETDVPDKSSSEVLNPGMDIEVLKSVIETTDKEVIYFEEGVYNFGPEVGKDYKGFQIPLRSDKKYYLPGGTVIIGSFYSKSGVSGNKLYGRGVVTACGKGRLGSDKAIPYNLYFAGAGKNNIVEGIHFNNPAHFCVLSRGELKTQYTKMFGWYHQTDGWGAGDDSVLRDCFIKVNDDFIKIYRDNMTVKNVILYKQINGAGVQLGWGSYGAASRCTIEDLYVVKDDEKTPGAISNTAVINLVNNNGSLIEKICFKNIYLENKVQRLLGLSGSGGELKDLSFENIYVQGGTYSDENYIATRNNTRFLNLRFKNLYYGKKKIVSEMEMGLRQYLLKDKKTIRQKDYRMADIIFE
ncbi:hypothetical protein [Bacteroides sp.]|uniref:hypothetical protein n=1 Tax=Bacteroides sp. TaxID=29523 RepID=UPI003A940CBD